VSLPGFAAAFDVAFDVVALPAGFAVDVAGAGAEVAGVAVGLGGLAGVVVAGGGGGARGGGVREDAEPE